MALASQAFSSLILEQLDAVDRFAASLCSNRAEIDDLVQETYLRALKAADKFELREKGVRPWLYRILHNIYRTRRARENRQPKAMETEQLEAIPSENLTLFELLGTSAGDNEVADAVQTLPEDLKSTLLLWAVDEMPYREIAEVLEIPIGTVMSRLHRSRKLLAEKLGMNKAGAR